jgi:site-specific recombinase XerD
MRNFYLEIVLESGINIRIIQTILGHSSTKVTEIYVQVATN